MKLKHFFIQFWTTLLSFVICIGVLALFCTRKTGMFIDEIYTYGLSNSSYAPYLTDVKDGHLSDKIITREEIKEYLSVNENDRFAFGSVYYNQSRDVHPPLYYWLFNCVSSFFPGSFSKWIGLGLNAGVFLISLFIFYRLLQFLFGRNDISATGVVILGTSVLALSMVMMIRMYTLLTLFTILLALVTSHLIHEPGEPKYFIFLTLSVFLGVMTQYYFVFYAFFLTFTYDIFALCNKRWKSALWFSICSLSGILLMILVFPSSLRQLFVGNGQIVGGSTVIEMIKDISAYKDRIDAFLKVKLRLKGLRWLLYGSIGLLLLTAPGIIRSIKKRSIQFDSLLITFPLLPSFLLTAIISPVEELRYIYNLTPIAVLGVCFIFYLSAEGFEEITDILSNKKTRQVFNYTYGKIIVCCSAAVSILCAKHMPPDNLFADHAVLNELCREYKGTPVVYITNEKFAPLTQDLLQLVEFDSVFVTNNPSSQPMTDYIHDADKVILYIDTNRFWSSGYEVDKVTSEFSDKTGLKNCRLLYKYTYEGIDGLSSAYLLNK